MRVFWSEQELADLRELSQAEFLARYPYRNASAWRNKRQKEGMHANPALAPDGTPWGLTSLQANDVSTAPNDVSSAPPTVTSIVGVTAGERPDPEEIRRRHALAFRRVAAIEERKRFQSIDISHGPAMIALVSDVHIGSPGVDIERVYAEQDLINSTPGAYTFLLGDIVDNMIVGRLRDYGLTRETTIPDEWVLFEHYVGRWKNLLAFVGGNHDAWSRQMLGADLHRRLIPETALYDTDDLRVTVNVGNKPVKFRLRHKWKGYSQYNKSHGQEKSVAFDDHWPDILVGGHTHVGALAREMNHAGKRKIAVQLGSYKLVDDFAIREGFPKADQSTAAAVIIFQDGTYMATGSLQAASHIMHCIYERAA